MKVVNRRGAGQDDTDGIGACVPRKFGWRIGNSKFIPRAEIVVVGK